MRLALWEHPLDPIDAARIAAPDRKRWRIEHLFQPLESAPRREMRGRGPARRHGSMGKKLFMIMSHEAFRR